MNFFRSGSPARTACSGRVAPAGFRRESASTSTPNSGMNDWCSLDLISRLRSFWDYQFMLIPFFCRFDHHLRNDPLPEILRVPLEQMVLRIKVLLLLLFICGFMSTNCLLFAGAAPVQEPARGVRAGEHDRAARRQRRAGRETCCGIKAQHPSI